MLWGSLGTTPRGLPIPQRRAGVPLLSGVKARQQLLEAAFFFTLKAATFLLRPHM
jgi:hypothetical protein